MPFTLIGQHHALHAIKFTQSRNNKEEFVTCKNFKMTTLASIFQTKLVFQMIIRTDRHKLENFTSFNDAIQSFLTLKCPTPMSELK